jgi:hypothetical protein
VDLHNKQQYRDQLIEANVGQRDVVKDAKSAIATYKIAEGWRNSKPRYVACLADLTNAGPKSTKPEVFLYGLTLDDSMHGEIHGRAINKAAANDFYKSLNGNTKRFTNVNADVESANTNPDTKAEFHVSFTIKFTYLPG